jgi:hypothetical protein
MPEHVWADLGWAAGTGKTYIARAIKRHLEFFGMNVRGWVIWCFIQIGLSIDAEYTQPDDLVLHMKRTYRAINRHLEFFGMNVRGRPLNMIVTGCSWVYAKCIPPGEGGPEQPFSYICRM